MRYSITFYSDKVEKEIAGLPARLVARFIHYAERMEIFGADLGMPHTRAMGDGLFELRLKGAEGIARVFYCTLAGRKIVFLHQFIKKSDRTPIRELNVAHSRMKEIRYAK
jgi:phage-related protein